MVKDAFETLMEELGKVIDIADLHPDRNRSCLINFPNGLQVQIEMDPHGQFVVLGCDLGQISTGRYRANYFKEALKANGKYQPSQGILSYSQKSDHVILFENLPMKDLVGEKIADVLVPFTEKALVWKEALSKGEIPALTTLRTSAGMFGLRP